MKIRKKMKIRKYLFASAVIVSSVIFTGCTQDQENLALAGAGVAAVAVVASNYNTDGSHTGNYYHKGYDYGTSRNYAYRDGVREGCQSRNYWTQNYYRYQNDYNYQSGWKAGYRQCR
jgi:hypothetical protein